MWGQLLKPHLSLEKSARRANAYFRLRCSKSSLGSAKRTVPSLPSNGEERRHSLDSEHPPPWKSLAQHRQVTWEPGSLSISPPQLERSAPQPGDHAPSIARMLMAPQALVYVEFVLGLI